MRILAVNWLDRENPQAGGAEIHLFEILRRLVARGHRVTLVASGWAGAAPGAVLDGVEVRRSGGRHTFAVVGRRAVRRALAGGPYDIVVEDINKLPLYLPLLTDLPCYVIIPHLFGTTAFREASWAVGGVVWLAEKPIPAVYRRAAFHAISESTRADLIDRGIAASAIRVINPGVDSDRLTPAPGVREADPTFLYVGRLKRYKGLDVAIRAVAEVRRQGHGVCLWVAGQGDDEPRLRRLCASLGVEDTVRFLGFVSEDEKRSLLRRAWATVFPSAKEGWGITNLEAAACGTPAVASDRPGLRDSVRDGETGLLVPHGDVAALAHVVIRLARDPDLVARLGTAGRVFAEAFTWDRTADETEQHLVDTVERAHRARKE